MADKDQDIFAPPTKDELKSAHEEAFKPVTDQEKAAVVKYMSTPKPGMLESALGGAEQGLTLSHAPQIAGLTGAALEGGANALGAGPNTGQNLAQLYNEYKGAKQKQLAAQESANPTSFAAGSLAGGALGVAGGNMALKGAGLIAPAVPGAAAPTMAARMRQGAAIGAGMGAVSAQGQSNAPMLSGQMAADMTQGAQNGAMTGAALTPIAEGAIGTANKLGRGIAQTSSALGGEEAGQAFMRGFGSEGKPGQLLIGDKAARNVAEQLHQTSAEIPQTIEQTLEGAAKTKQGIINAAAEKGVKVDPTKIDDFVKTYTSDEPNHIDESVNNELSRLQEMIKKAQSGREVEQVSRKFFADGNTERGKFANLFQQKQLEEQAKLAPDVPAPQTEKDQFEELYNQKVAEQKALPGAQQATRGKFANLFQQKQLEEQAKLAPDVPAPQTEKDQFEELYNQKVAEQKALPGAQSATPLELSYEPIDGTTDHVLGVIKQKQFDADGNFTGYKKVAAQPITPDAPAHDRPQLQMELQPLPGAPGKSLGIIKQAVLDDDGNVSGYKVIASKQLSDVDAAPLELSYEPIDGTTDQVLGVIKQKQFDAYGNFTGYKKVATRPISPDAPAHDRPQLQMELQPLPGAPGKSLGIIKQATLDDQGNVSGYKVIASKQLSDVDAAKFRDMSEIVRANDKDLTDPRQLYDLYKTLKNRSQFGEKNFQTPEALGQTGQAIQDIQGMLRGTDQTPGAIPQLKDVDSDISNLNQAKEAVGLNNNMSDPNQNKLIANLVTKSIGTDFNAVEAQNQLNKMVASIKNVDPEYATQVHDQIKEMQNQMKVTGNVQESIYVPRLLSRPRAAMNKGANVLGYAIGSVTPDFLRGVATDLSKAVGNTGAQGLAKTLVGAASKDDNSRNAIMFGLMQNAGYRAMLEPYLQAHPANNNDQHQTAKNTSLEKYK